MVEMAALPGPLGIFYLFLFSQEEYVERGAFDSRNYVAAVRLC